jgi:hypothetical protein
MEINTTKSQLTPASTLSGLNKFKHFLVQIPRANAEIVTNKLLLIFFFFINMLLLYFNVRPSLRFLQSATPLTVTTQWIDLNCIMYLKYIVVVHNGF